LNPSTGPDSFDGLYNYDRAFEMNDEMHGTSKHLKRVVQCASSAVGIEIYLRMDTMSNPKLLTI